jgi:hypothetical protein
MKTICSLAVLGILIPTIACAEDKGFIKIFDGKSLDGWEGKKGLWSVEEGAITGQTSADSPLKKNTFLIWRKAQLRDFSLRLKFRLVSEKGNSGIQFRSKEMDDFVVGGYQADIDSKPHRYMGILYEERGRGILAERSSKVVINERGKKEKVGSTLDEKKFMSSIKEGGWNDYLITVKGNHIEQKINGFTTVDVTDEQASRAAKEGILALQLHAGPPMKIQFKDILLKSN